MIITIIIMHKPAAVLENDEHLWDFNEQSDHFILPRRRDLIIIKNNNNKKRQFAKL